MAPLTSRHRDKNGEINKRYGNTKVGTLRQIYGNKFAPGFSDDATLSHVLAKLDELSLSQLVKDQISGRLREKIAFSESYGALGKDYRP